MAVGAEKRTILRLVLRDVGVVLFVGCCAGVLLALGTTRLLATGTAVHGGPLLFGVQPHDLATPWGCVSPCWPLQALIAAYLLARRASHLDPMPVLREE
jgi:ABC-type antimicrobial peptide transport system permease subunit